MLKKIAPVQIAVSILGRLFVNLPKALLFACVIDFISTTSDMAIGKAGFNDPNLGSASVVTRTILLYAPYPWAGLAVSALLLTAKPRVSFKKNWFQLLWELALFALLFCCRELFEWRLVPANIESEMSLRRAASGVVLVIITISMMFWESSFKFSTPQKK